MESVVVAYSGGVDSTLLLKAAKTALGDKAIAATIDSCLYPQRELQEAIAFCKAEGIEQIVIERDELAIEGFKQNPTNRCYLCKHSMLGEIEPVAKERGATMLEGANLDDDVDFRPGRMAVLQHGARSPLREAGLRKSDIRAILREFGISFSEKPSFACLASRFPYGEIMTKEKLRRIDSAEQYLLDLGFRQIRVRSHENLARIEADDLSRFFDKDLRENVVKKFKEYGYTYVSLDLIGYRTGAMNETLSESAKEQAKEKAKQAALA
jgi:uncharacterized protein